MIVASERERVAPADPRLNDSMTLANWLDVATAWCESAFLDTRLMGVEKLKEIAADLHCLEDARAATPVVQAGDEPAAWQWRAGDAHPEIAGAQWQLSKSKARAEFLAARWQGDVRPLYAAPPGTTSPVVSDAVVTDEMVEQACRAFQVARGNNPDWEIEGCPTWVFVKAGMEAALRAATPKYPDGAQAKPLADAIWQLLDDMGKSGTSVSVAAKAMARVAYEPFADPEAPLEYGLAEARETIVELEATASRTAIKTGGTS